jgi:hypothetical protein
MADREEQTRPLDGAAGSPPPPDPGHVCVEWCPICRGAEVLRETTSPEIREGWTRVQREALLTMHALIDHYLERMEEDGRAPGPRVEDIRVD